VLGLLQNLGVKGARGFSGGCQSGPLFGKDVTNKSSVCGKCLPGAGKQLALLTLWGFNSTGPKMVASVNVQPGILESSLVKLSMFNLNP